ncbi:alpha-ribazole-5-phosphate synthase [Planococcus beigongshangi]|uniref:alpha-ribazole-5-phosphate synthase n=1 Tax=Planococcus beigongshangi TaxID=2782536 RepID=UPI00193BA92A|nr:alpha-ribazole-5-phosphate synthase [Planococcus beigongshangi]
MRHELQLDGWIITTDNSAGIGEKPLDAVKAPAFITAKFAARVALLEQWAAGSEPQAVLLQNFSGASQWGRYIAGIEELFEEAGLDLIPITGSSETNMETLQSGIAVTMLGKRVRDIGYSDLQWFAYGMPLAGDEVLKNIDQIADLKKIHGAVQQKMISRLWPVGSKGIAAEVELMMGKAVSVTADLDLVASGGPAASVLIGIREEKVEAAKEYLGEPFYPLFFK